MFRLPTGEGDSLEIYPAKKGGELVGYAVNTYTNDGFSGYINLMAGFKPDGTIINISVLNQKETPGLGTKMAEPGFKDQFKEKNPAEFSLKVKKDGGPVDAITAATISSRAFCDAVQRAYSTIQKGGLK
jgi:electron transport complex protein RnfG